MSYRICLYFTEENEASKPWVALIILLNELFSLATVLQKEKGQKRRRNKEKTLHVFTLNRCSPINKVLSILTSMNGKGFIQSSNWLP